MHKGIGSRSLEASEAQEASLALPPHVFSASALAFELGVSSEQHARLLPELAEWR